MVHYPYMIEVEQRGLLTKEEFERVESYLRAHATHLNEDHKYVEYFIYGDKLLKIIRNDSRQNATLSLKLNTLGNGALFKELECSLPWNQFSTLQEIMHAITTPDQVITGTQKRENFMLDSVEIALKWSEDWGYHFELEVKIDEETESARALELMGHVAEKLGVTIMSEAEVKEFSQKVRERAKK